MTPLMELMELLQRQRSLTKMADRSTRSRQTFSAMRNDPHSDPEPATLDALEVACGLPRGTAQKVIDGELSPEEGADLFDTRGRSVSASTASMVFGARAPSSDASHVVR